MQNETTQKNQTLVKPESKKPNETGSIRVEGFVKIYDPNNKEIFVEKRA